MMVLRDEKILVYLVNINLAHDIDGVDELCFSESTTYCILYICCTLVKKMVSNSINWPSSSLFKCALSVAQDRKSVV